VTTTASAVSRINVRDALASADRWRVRQQATLLADLCDSLRRKDKRALPDVDASSECRVAWDVMKEGARREGLPAD
jgi:hypothetical protein